jgi:glutamyl-tRNA synthetase
MTRVRFAPSPTGNLHIGSARTALFNWIFARSLKGTYILRVEDTDSERSKSEYEQNILDGLEWLGLNMDEGPGLGGDFGPYRQSERMAQGIYLEYAQKLLSQGSAYPCFCTDEEIEAERAQARSANENYLYSRKCLNLTAEQIAQKKEQGIPNSIKFKMPDTELEYTDLIRDKIHFDLSLFSDFVIIKSDKSPSYNFAVVVDDMLMKITHVVRGEDHISNTPKQICIYNAFNVEPPQFAHLPMILGPDRSKMSKRHGATSITEYQEMGFLSETLFNYLVLLGWGPQNDQEIMLQSEIVNQFSLERITKSGAIFDINKLKWMNGQYTRMLEKDELTKIAITYISAENKAKLEIFDLKSQSEIVYSFKEKLEVLSDINQKLLVYLYSLAEYQELIKNFTFSEQEIAVIRAFASKIKNQASLTTETINQVF